MICAQYYYISGLWAAPGQVAGTLKIKSNMGQRQEDDDDSIDIFFLISSLFCIRYVDVDRRLRLL